MAIDKGTIDAVLTDIDTGNIEKLPENIRLLLGGISKVTKTCFILISHDNNRKFCTTLNCKIPNGSANNSVYPMQQANRL